jgi:hypothetical protein
LAEISLPFHRCFWSIKIWIQSDGTEIGVANELVEAGVPQQDIVLAFKSPFKRQFTDMPLG